MGFTFDEENRLEYTQIHMLYEQGLEEQFAAALSNLELSMSDLEDALSSRQSFALVDGLDEAVTAAVHLILERSDFVAFKDAMLLEVTKMQVGEVSLIGSLE